jgi:hypothetical protein
MNIVDIGTTSKGKRVWLQGLNNKGLCMPRYDTVIQGNTIIITMGIDGKRKVTASKGGIIDLVSKSITMWAQDSLSAQVVYGVDMISITRI